MLHGESFGVGWLLSKYIWIIILIVSLSYVGDRDLDLIEELKGVVVGSRCGLWVRF